MASSAHDQPKIELVGLPAPNDLPVVSTTPQAAATSDDQPALGYPPVIGYPQGDPRYHGIYAYPYPAPPPNIHGPFPAPDHDASYAQQQVESHMMPPRMRNGIMTSITVSSLLLVAAVVVVVQTMLWYRMPDLTLTGFSVSDLSVSIDSVMLANWDANITVENRNKHIRLKVTSLTSVVYYMDPDKYLSSKGIDGPLNLGTRSSRVANLKMTTSALEQPQMRAIEAVRNGLQQSSTRMVFGLEVNVVGKFQYSWWWKKSIAATAYCEYLWVYSPYYGSSASGSLSARAYHPTKCQFQSTLS